MLPLHTHRLHLVDGKVEETPTGTVLDMVVAHLRAPDAAGLVVLGGFGSGKTSLCRAVADHADPSLPPCSVVPLSVVGRAADIEAGLLTAVGATRLEEARQGRRVLLLDGLDEVPSPASGSYAAFFDEVTSRVGPRWVLTSRPGHIRTSVERDPEQADSLDRDDIVTLLIDPVDPRTVHAVLGELPRGQALLRSVDNLTDLASTPLLLHIILAALPHIEVGRPIDAWGLLDAWLRFSLRTGPDHDAVLARLEALAWSSFRESDYSPEAMSFRPDQLAEARIPAELRRTLMVTDLDGRVRFGHRSLFEYLLAAHMSPRLSANQGHGPDELTGLRLTDAARAFLVGRVAPMPVTVERERVLIPRGNFVAGGVANPDERRLRIAHVAEPFWISRTPVTQRQWASYLTAHPDSRMDAGYLPHWGPERTMPKGQDHQPIYDVWPEDADAYAAHVGARLPQADEWEKAVRGIDGRRWPWGDWWRPGAAVTSELGVQAPLPVRAFGAHGHAALFSTVGGVFEYTATPYRQGADRGRVVMGGCYTHPHDTARSSLRLSHKLSGRLKAGLRLAWDT